MITALNKEEMTVTKQRETTNPLFWRLRVKEGRQTWVYLDNYENAKEWPQNDFDKYWQGLPLDVCEGYSHILYSTLSYSILYSPILFYSQLYS
jgi:hypothetical protein